MLQQNLASIIFPFSTNNVYTYQGRLGIQHPFAGLPGQKDTTYKKQKLGYY